MLSSPGLFGGCNGGAPAETGGSESEGQSGDGDGDGDGDESTSGDGDGTTLGDGDGDEPICGNGVAEYPDEACDGDDLNGTVCQELGAVGGTLACNDDCTVDESGCLWEPICGDGFAQAGGEIYEICDGEDFNGETCMTQGDFVGGELSCSDTCDAIGTLSCLSPGEDTSCVDDMDCPMEAPSCIDMTCWNGSETDPCEFNSDCLSDTCDAPNMVCL